MYTCEPLTPYISMLFISREKLESKEESTLENLVYIHLCPWALLQNLAEKDGALSSMNTTLSLEFYK